MNNKRTFYSIRDLNKSKEHRTIALKNKSGEVVAFGMEDATNLNRQEIIPEKETLAMPYSILISQMDQPLRLVV